MTEGVVYKKLGNLCTVQGGADFYRFHDDGERIFPIELTKDAIIITSSNVYRREKDVENKDDVLDGYVLMKISAEINPNYLYCFLESIYNEQNLDVIVCEDDMRDIDIFIPPREKQDEWVEQIEKTKKAIEHLKKIADSIVTSGIEEFKLEMKSRQIKKARYDAGVLVNFIVDIAEKTSSEKDTKPEKEYCLV